MADPQQPVTPQPAGDRCVAHYFTQFRAARSNAYARLLEHLEYRRALFGTVFSSLNYECVFETAARNYGFREIAYDATEPTRTGVLTIWKLHGSCNFLPASVSAGAHVASYAPSAVSWDGEARIADPVEARRLIEVSAFYPAMAVFMAGKPIHSHPAIIHELQGRWAAAVENASTIGIIGVAPNAADSHLWEPLAKTPARIVVVGDKPAYKAWADQYRREHPPVVVGTRFGDCLDDFAKELGDQRPTS